MVVQPVEPRLKYAREVIDLMAAYPGRRWTMGELVTYLTGPAPMKVDRDRVRQGVHRVIRGLEDSGTVTVVRQEARGGDAFYVWSVTRT